MSGQQPDPAAVLQRVDEIEAREQAATQGPWALDTDWCDCGDGYGCSHGEYPCGIDVPSIQVAWGFAKDRPDATKHAAEIVDEFGENATMADGEFIVHSREDVKWLCQQLRTALADTRRVEEYRDVTGCEHGLHEVCDKCLCPTCGTRSAELTFEKAPGKVRLPIPAIRAAMAATPREDK